MRTKSRWHARTLLAVFGIALVIVFVLRIGPHAIAAELAHVGPEGFLVLVPYAIGTTIGAFPWSWLIEKPMRPTWRATIASRFTASGANAMLPFFGLAGEPSRLLWLAPESRAAGMAAMLVDRALYNAGSALVLLTAVLLSYQTSLPGLLRILAAVVAVLILLVTIGALYSVARFGVGRRLQGLLGRFLGEAYRHDDFGREVDGCLHSLLSHKRAPLVAGLLVHFLGRAAICLEVQVAFHSLGAPASAAATFVLATVPVATGLFASIIPSQIGIQEGAQASICIALGLNPALGIALAVLLRLRQLAYVSLTPLLVLSARPRDPRPFEADTPSTL